MHPLQYDIDLALIDGVGDFPCPRCGITISPEDESENTYVILETRFRNEDLKEVIIGCKTCGCTIRLKGFEKLEVAQ